MSWKSDKIIPIYKNGHGIYEVLAELQKGERELKKQEKMYLNVFKEPTAELKVTRSKPISDSYLIYVITEICG